jgi:hypothetical protein
MAKNLSVEDTKPKNKGVEDTQPKNTGIAIDFGTEQLFTVVLNAGQVIGPGFLMFIPYLTAGTVLSPITN